MGLKEMIRMVESELQRKEREWQDDLARLRGLRPMDDDFMRCIFKDNIPLAQLVLRILLREPKLVVEKVETQRDNKRLVGGRSVSFDVYIGDDRQRKENVEIQRSDKGAGKRRARYHSSVMDVENLNAGQEFDALPETYVIFITEKDPFGDGKPYHRIERTDLDTEGRPLFDDGEHILYVNGSYDGDSDIGKLMHDFRCSVAKDMYFREMQEITHHFKETEEGVEFMCRAFEEIRAESERNGKYQEKIDTALRMIKLGKNLKEEIALVTGLPIEKVKELAEVKPS
jgi:hypothetical protein